MPLPRRPSGSAPSSRIHASGNTSRRLAAPAAAPSGNTGRMQRAGGAPPPPAGQKKDNTPMIVGGVCVGILALIGLGFAMSGGEKPKKKEPPKAVAAPKEPEKPAYDPWSDPSQLGSESDMAKRRKEGNKEQNKTGEVSHPVGTEGGK